MRVMLSFVLLIGLLAWMSGCAAHHHYEECSEGEGHSKDHWDTIVCGAGIGGLATAAVLARVGQQRVLVLEQHNVAGGASATIKKTVTYEDPETGEVREALVPLQLGFHYAIPVPEALPEFEMITGKHYDYFLTESPFDLVLAGNRPGPEHKIQNLRNFYDAEMGVEGSMMVALSWFVEDTISGYPQFAPQILQFIDDFVGALNGTRPDLSFMPMSRYLSDLFGDDPETVSLKQMLWVKLEDFGTDVDRATFGENVYILTQFLLYGIGDVSSGSVQFLDDMIEAIEAAGGEVRLEAHVKEILTRDQKEAYGVFVEDKKKKSKDGKVETQMITADNIVSNMGIEPTFRCGMINEKVLSKYKYRMIANRVEFGTTVITVNLAFNQSAETLGFPKGSNIFFYPDEQVSIEDYSKWDRPEVGSETDLRQFLWSFGSTRQPDMVAGRPICWLTMMCTTPWHWYADWEDSTLEDRPDEYWDWLMNYAVANMKKYFYSVFPDAEQHENAFDVASPLDIRDRYDMVEGAYCGTMPLQKIWHPKLLIEHLYLVGKDQKGCGVQLAAMSGIIAAFDILGIEFEDPIQDDGSFQF